MDYHTKNKKHKKQAIANDNKTKTCIAAKDGKDKKIRKVIFYDLNSITHKLNKLIIKPLRALCIKYVFAAYTN